MSLTLEWFADKDKRKQKRDKNGVSIEEAINCLESYRSSLNPIAYEIAEWIDVNWSQSQVIKLPEDAHEILSRIRNERAKQSPDLKVDDAMPNDTSSSNSENSYLNSVLEKIRTRLIDQTRRNRLINHKETARDIAIIDEMPDQVYDHLVSNGKVFYFDHFEPIESTDDIPRLFGIEEADHLEETNDEPDRTLPKSYVNGDGIYGEHERYSDNRLQTPFTEKLLERRLRNLYLGHRSSIQETGANNLYLVIGFLEWFDSENTVASRSPLFLVPVHLKRERSVGQVKYSIRFDDEALDTNYSLVEKLKNQFDIDFPFLSDDKSPEIYWDEVEEAIQNKVSDGWQVIREMSLGLFRFSKQIMWHDLNPDRWPAHAPITNNGTIQRILLGASEGQTSPGQLTGEYSQDAVDESTRTPLKLITNADSSQYTAIVDALETEDGLVIEGPPGTGKSQTITNLIASALNDGKTVLFLAEKMAALEVVYNRLTDSKLDKFCFQLHGLKTSKKEILESVVDRLEHNVGYSQRDLDKKKNDLELTKKSLIEYSNALNTVIGPEGVALYDVIWKIENLHADLPEGFEPVDIENSQVAYEVFHKNKNLLSDLEREWSSIPVDARQFWSGYMPFKTDRHIEEQFISDTHNVIEHSMELTDWLNNHDADNNKSLYKTLTLLQIGKHKLDEAMPLIPSGADISLIFRVVHNNLLSEFGELLEMLVNFQKRVEKINRVFDYASSESNSYAKLLHKHSENLSNVACTPSVSINNLPNEKINFVNTISIIDSLSEIAQPIIELVKNVPRTLDDYEKFSKHAVSLAAGPKQLSLHSNPIHVKTAVSNYLEEAKKLNREILDSEDGLQLFYVEKCRDTDGIIKSCEIIEEFKDSWFPIFNSEYRKSKRKIKGLLRSSRDFNRKEAFLIRLSYLSNYCQKRDNFFQNADLNTALGSLFKGIETNWQDLELIINFSQKLRLEYGADKAISILGDWDCHLDKMTLIHEKLEECLGSVVEFREHHPFPKTLWSRPLAEISATLSPWVNSIQDAVSELSRNWCEGEATLKEMMETADHFRVVKSLEHEIQSHKNFNEILSSSWEGSNTNNAVLNNTHEWIRERLETSGIDINIMRWLLPTEEIFRREYYGQLIQYASQFRHAVAEQIRHLGSCGETNLPKWIGGRDSTIETFVNKQNGSIESVNNLTQMVRWNALKQKVNSMGLGEFSDLVSDGTLHSGMCSKSYEYSLYSKLLSQKISEFPILSTFGRSSYENLRDRFAELDKEVLSINSQGIASDLMNKRIPDGVGRGRVSEYSEKRLIDNEARKKTRHIPIRQLVRRSGNALQALKPCFLMSPLSVAQYLPPGEIQFDFVIMDEASQLRPEDALGAIARAKKCIIVGDPKQLPPTTFFDTASNDEFNEEETSIDDTESILDVCLKQFPYRRLRWHYRSEHESLIQFSNEKFYDHDLIIFPSPKGDSRDYGVHHHYIDEPSYKRGKNRREAEVVVENIIHHYRRHHNKSLGVATFNKRQAEEIEMLLDHARSEDPAINECMEKHELNEPLFIKNLENVQGDERDVIFISTTYGPEYKGGPVQQNFGPINFDSGWRRLNVIITRAKQRVELFTSMRATDIKLAGARRGKRALRDYIEYAETGRITEHGIQTGGAPDSEFEEAVIKIISDMGYECDSQVGVAGFFIDIGVKHPDRPGEYLLGVECDGAAYHSGLSVRDRDRNRQEILESKGWHIHRVWSTSWFHDRGTEIDRLQSIIEEKLNFERMIQDDISDYQEIDEVVINTKHASDEEIVAEATEVIVSLEYALDRFWEKNIQPYYPDRSGSILSKPLVKKIIDVMPETNDDWYEAIPMVERQKINPKEMEHLDDILDVVYEYN